MNCPKCGGEAYVRDSKPSENAIHRQRVCKKCKHIFFTIESDAGSHLPFYEAQSQYYKARYAAKKREK